MPKAFHGSNFRVVHLPFDQQNPYQTQLLEALSQLGVNVYTGKSKWRFLGKALCEWKADILHFHWVSPFLFHENQLKMLFKGGLFLLEVVSAKWAGYGIVWTVHNFKNHENRNLKLEALFTRWFVRFVDKIIVHCAAAKTEACWVFAINDATRIQVIPHGNYVNAYPNTITRAEARQRFGFGADEVVFLLLGLLRPYKGALELIDSFRTLKLPKARLLIAGQTTDKAGADSIKKRVGDDPTIQLFPEFIANEDIQFYMNAADVAVFPYRDILTSGAVLLAMSFGKPCIAPRLGCIPETLAPSGGLLYDNTDQNGLCNAMKSMAKSVSQLDAMGKENLDCAKRLNWQEIAAKTQAVYAECVHKGFFDVFNR